MEYVSHGIEFLGYLGLFLFGMTVLSKALQKSAGCKMKQLLGKMSKSRFRGVLFGAGVTAVIQSSTATTVMAVGFVNAGIISLTQIVGIIMGANIGSTTTSWLVSSAEWMSFLKPSYLGAVFACGGALALMFSKKENVKNIAEVFVGFGVLFLGLANMPGAVRPLAELDAVSNAFVTFGNNPLLALLVGILVTAVIQSSTASIGILQSMAVAGMIPWSAAVFIVLGQNVGTCFTTMLTSIGANKNTRAASFVHFVYNAVGAVIFSLGAFVYFTFINPESGAVSASSTNVSMIHTGYNVALLIIMFPLGGLIMKIAEGMAGKDKTKADSGLTELDESILETPEYAFGNVNKAAGKLTDLLHTNIVLSADIFLARKLAADETDKFSARAADVEKASVEIRAFLTKLYSHRLSEQQNLHVAALMNNLARLERINNRTRGIVKQKTELQKENLKLEYSKEAIDALKLLSEKTVLCYNESISAGFAETDSTLAARAAETADEVQALYEDYKREHLARVSGGEYSIKTGTAFLEVARHLSRIGSNAKNIAETADN
jgi:phosphate:Na+ symporter